MAGLSSSFLHYSPAVLGMLKGGLLAEKVVALTSGKGSALGTQAPPKEATAVRWTISLFAIQRDVLGFPTLAVLSRASSNWLRFSYIAQVITGSGPLISEAVAQLVLPTQRHQP
ncbi:unnamed protein product [Clonostachys chloroleuca]|uniref:Uncharacterized protein n=1 Tax=Clonostachys chloroleuca TaxID=1926264 RepID=A0AA35MCD3_9HYPO|nr:unnamed protein product [Clonostachys chloroleuca]